MPALDGKPFADGLSGPGKYVEMRAEMDVLVLISNCPQLNNPCNAYDPRKSIGSDSIDYSRPAVVSPASSDFHWRWSVKEPVQDLDQGMQRKEKLTEKAQHTRRMCAF